MNFGKTIALFSLLPLAAAAGDLDVARQALRDGLWEIARVHAAKAVGDGALLVTLESFAGEGRWDEVKKTVAAHPEAKGDGFDYYRAVVRGDHETALKLLKKGGDAAALVEARMYEAGELSKAGKRAEAEKLWREVAAVTNAGERATALAAVNLMDAALMEKAYAGVRSTQLKRLLGVRLGTAWLREPATAAKGEALVRAVVKDSPDAEGVRGAFLAIADLRLSEANWKAALAVFAEITDVWPDQNKTAAVQEGRGWALAGLGRHEEALEAFELAEKLAADDEGRALAAMKQGDVLTKTGRNADSLAKYREVLAKYPKTGVAARLAPVVRVRELEQSGRDAYRASRYDAARKAFAEVAALDAARSPRMEFFSVLCLYGAGDEDAAATAANALVEKCTDAAIRAEATLWLAKLRYNHREWKEAWRLFSACEGAEALLWAARAAFADNDFNLAIQTASKLVERYADSPLRPRALLLQGEALAGLARFDEAVLVLERVAISEKVPADCRDRALMVKGDSLYAMGADDRRRYNAALETYNSLRFGGSLNPSGQLVIAFRIARTLEKLKRLDDAVDQYYVQVVLAYRDGRLKGELYDDEARAAFSKAAFRLADEYESRGRDSRAIGILELVSRSDVPAAEEASARIKRISNKGRFL